MTDDAKRSTIQGLIAKGAHLVRVGADKRPFDAAWQEAPWTGEGAFVEIAHVPGRIGYLVCDVDVLAEAAREAITWIRDRLGMELFSVRTPSGGWHLYYRVGAGQEIPNWRMQWGDLRCDSGYAILWGAGAGMLLSSLSDEDPVAPMGRDIVLSRLAPGRKVAQEAPAPRGAGGRGHVEGDRNNGLYDKCLAALANEADPEPWIEKAVREAKEAGLPFKEIDEAVASARKSHAAQNAPRRVEVPPGTSALGKVVLGWRREVEGVLVTREHEISAKALRRVDSIVRKDTTDAIHRMHEVSRAWGEGGDPSVEALYRSRVAEMVQGGLDWSLDVEPRWLVEGFLPLHRLNFVFAKGGIGKTRIAIQAALGGASGCGIWLPGSTGHSSIRVRAPLRVLMVSWEDTQRGVMRALKHAARVLGIEDVQAAVEDRFQFFYAGRLGPLWAPTGGSGHISTIGGLTDAGLWLLEKMPDFDLAILDPLAAVYGSDENARGLVRPFISCIDEAAQDAECTVLVLGHSSKEHVVSGSTDWENAVRSVLSLEVVERKEQPKPGKKATLQGRGVCLSVVKLNEAVEPDPVWLVPGPDGYGWCTATREESEAVFTPLPEV